MHNCSDLSVTRSVHKVLVKSLGTLSVLLLLLFNANVAKDDLQSLLRLSFYGMCIDWTGTRINPSASAGIPKYQGCICAERPAWREESERWVAVYGKWKRYTQASLSLANAERWNIHQSGCLPWWCRPAHPLYFVITLPDPSYHLKPASPTVSTSVSIIASQLPFALRIPPVVIAVKLVVSGRLAIPSVLFRLTTTPLLFYIGASISNPRFSVTSANRAAL